MADSKGPADTRRDLPNKYIKEMESDFLYHLGYSREDCKMFRDIKYVVSGGSMKRMADFAELIAKEINYPCEDIHKTDRFALFKIGPVLSISHGMGVPSVSIMLHELIKLLYYADAKDPIILRMGTSGGIGVLPGTVVITNKVFNAFCKETHEIVVLGKTVSRSTIMDQQVAKDILSCQDDTSFPTVLGGTMCTDEFYEGQGRIDGAICEHTDEEKLAYLKGLNDLGISNIEMETSAVAALTHKTGVKSGIVCVALLDRLLGDQVDITPEVYNMYQSRPLNLVVKFIKSKLACSA